MLWYSLVYFFFLHWNNTKKQRKKAKSDMIPHRTPRTDQAKLLAPSNLYLVAHPLEKITEINRFLYPWMSILHLSTGILDHSSFANCSRSLTFEGCLLPTAVLRSYVITVCLHARKACSLTTKQSRALDTTVSNRRDSCATWDYFISNSKNETK